MNVAFIFKEQCGYNVVLIILSSKTAYKTCSQFFALCDGVVLLNILVTPSFSYFFKESFHTLQSIMSSVILAALIAHHTPNFGLCS
jgi:hypothetical protein